MTPAEVLEAIKGCIERGATNPDGGALQYAINPGQPSTDLMQLAQNSFGLTLKTLTTAGRPRGRLDENGTVVVVGALPLNALDPFSSQQDGMRWHQSVTAALITQESVPGIQMGPTGTPELREDGDRLLVTSIFSVHFTWSPSTEL